MRLDKTILKIVSNNRFSSILDNKKLYVFCFHSVGDNPSKFTSINNLNISKSSFKKIVNYLLENFTIESPASYNLFDNISACAKPRALITFDDGFDDAFKNGISYLIERRIPVLMFLNMKNIIYPNIPLISAASQYLSTIDYFKDYKSEFNYLKCNPDTLDLSKLPFNVTKSILEFQGKLIDKSTLEHYLKSEYLYIGNHFYEHWNAKALTDQQIVLNFNLNHTILSTYDNYNGDFAFTNGLVHSCWNFKQYELIKELGASRIFSANGGLFNNGILIDRISLSIEDVDPNNLYYKIFKSKFRDFFLANYLHINKFFNKKTNL